MTHQRAAEPISGDLLERASVRSRRHAHPDPAVDRGVTFVEIVVTIALLGTVALTMLTAARVSIRSSETSRAAAEVESALIEAANRVERATDATYQCDVDAPIEAAAQLRLGSAATVDVSYEHLPPLAVAWSSGACPGAAGDGPGGVWGGGPGLLQRVTITIEGPTGLERTMEVVRGDI